MLWTKSMSFKGFDYWLWKQAWRGVELEKRLHRFTVIRQWKIRIRKQKAPQHYRSTLCNFWKWEKDDEWRIERKVSNHSTTSAGKRESIHENSRKWPESWRTCEGSYALNWATAERTNLTQGRNHRNLKWVLSREREQNFRGKSLNGQ